MTVAQGRGPAAKWCEVVQEREQAREEERCRLARELHDELGHALFALKTDTVWLRQRLAQFARPRADVEGKLAMMIELIEQSIQTVNGIVTDLRPPALDQLGLIAALEWQTESFARRSGIRCRFTGTADVDDLDAGRSTAVFRMFQEMLTNVQRHAQANRVTVSVQRRRNELTLSVRDNGCGVNTRAVAASSFGLLGMRERAVLLGGKLAIASPPRGGTTVTVVVPLANRRATKREPREHHAGDGAHA